MRPTVSVYSADTGKAVGRLRLPAIFQSPIRNDIVHNVHTLVRKNKRMPYGVFRKSGHQTSAESWGTGRAVARIPRVAGGGTHRAGQGAFGNMVRGGAMFSPLKSWRRWHRRVNVNMKRFAVCSALAASGVLGLVLARGHKVGHLPEIPLVIDRSSVSKLKKTKQAVAILKKLGAYGDVLRALKNQGLRAGRGKMRNRRYKKTTGPLIVYNKGGIALKRAFRNIPGVDTCSVRHLNILKLAPGGHLGRFIIWTSDAFAALDTLFSATHKGGFSRPQSKMTNASLTRILRSFELARFKRPRMKRRIAIRKKNPLRNFGLMCKLNPYIRVVRRRDIIRQRAFAKARALRAKFALDKKDPKHPFLTAFKKKRNQAKALKRKSPDYKLRKKWRTAKRQKAIKAGNAYKIRNAKERKEYLAKKFTEKKMKIPKKRSNKGILAQSLRSRRLHRKTNRKLWKQRARYAKLIFS